MNLECECELNLIYDTIEDYIKYKTDNISEGNKKLIDFFKENNLEIFNFDKKNGMEDFDTNFQLINNYLERNGPINSYEGLMDNIEIIPIRKEDIIEREKI